MYDNIKTSNSLFPYSTENTTNVMTVNIGIVSNERTRIKVAQVKDEGEKNVFI